MRSPLTEKYLPKKLSGKELDEYLAKGWYRLGAEVFTCQYLFFKEKLYSPVWLRLPLKDYTFRKRMRKIFNRNRRKYSFVIRPQEMSKEKDELYAKYRENFHSPLAIRLIGYLQDNAPTTVFNSQEICIYHEEKLVACSFFDLGEKSLTSIVGIYDPDYQKDSLGFYSMLLEIEYGLEHGYDFYYPGYIVPYYPKFDYKTRIGKPEELEFYDLRTGTWESYLEYDLKKTLTIETGDKLKQLGKILFDNGISNDLLFYPCYEPYLVKRHGLAKMGSPLFLSCYSDYFVQPQYLLLYDYFEETFCFYDCATPPPAATNENQTNQNAGEMLSFMKHQELLFQSSDIEEIVAKLRGFQLKLIARALAMSDEQ